MSLNVTIFKKLAVSLGLACSLMAPVLAAPKEPVVLKWLQADKVSGATGVSWGGWPRGTVKNGQTFTLSTSDGRNLPVQTWPMAYWPDGLLKWSGFASVAGHLTVLMGGPEIAGELAQLLDNPAFNKLWLQYARLHGAPAAKVQQALIGDQMPAQSPLWE